MKLHTRRPNAARGFTLVETLIAIGLVMVLLGSALSFWASVSAGVERLSGRMETHHAVRLFLERLEPEITCSLVGYASLGGGVKGDTTSLRLLVRGVDLSGVVGDDAAGPAAVQSDLQDVSYRFDGGTAGFGTLRVSRATRGGRSPLAGGMVSAGEEEADGTATDEGGEAGTMSSGVPGVTDGVIAEAVGLVRFRYHDGTAWVDSFDSWERGRLPAAIEVSVWFKPLPASRSDGARETNEGFGLDNEADESSAGELLTDPDAERELPPADLVRVFVMADGSTYEPGRSFEDVAEGSLEELSDSMTDDAGEER